MKTSPAFYPNPARRAQGFFVSTTFRRADFLNLGLPAVRIESSNSLILNSIFGEGSEIASQGFVQGSLPVRSGFDLGLFSEADPLLSST
jgi:hypothetical protein